MEKNFAYKSRTLLHAFIEGSHLAFILWGPPAQGFSDVSRPLFCPLAGVFGVLFIVVLKDHEKL